MPVDTLELMIISLIIIGFVYTVLYFFLGREGARGEGRSSNPVYTAGVKILSSYDIHLNRMVVYLFILLAVEALIILLFFTTLSIFSVAVFLLSIIAVSLGYSVYARDLYE